MTSPLRILLADLRSTVPVYTAYLCDALNRTGAHCQIAGIRRRRELNELDHLRAFFAPAWDFSNRLPPLLQKAGGYLEYKLNIRWLLQHAAQFDAVHLQWLPLLKYSDSDLQWVGKLLDLQPRLFFTVHNTLPHDLKNKAVRSRYAGLYRMLPRLIVHAAATRDRLVQEFDIDEKKISIVPHGPLYTEFARFTPAENPPLIGIIGTIRPYKGIEDALEVASLLKKNGTDFRLLLAGSGETAYLNKLRKRISELNLQDQVDCVFRYLPLREMISLYQRCSLVLAPYKEIDQSGAVITALSLGTPVAGYRVGGLDMLIRDGYNGKLVKPGDIEALLGAVLTLLAHPAKKLFDHSRTIADTFDWTESAQKLIDLYRK